LESDGKRKSRHFAQLLALDKPPLWRGGEWARDEAGFPALFRLKFRQVPGNMTAHAHPCPNSRFSPVLTSFEH
jgi:hypothetical protein